MFKDKAKPISPDDVSRLKSTAKHINRGTYYSARHAEDVGELIKMLLENESSLMLDCADYGLSTNSLYQKIVGGWQFIIENFPIESIEHIIALRKRVKIKILKKTNQVVIEYFNTEDARTGSSARGRKTLARKNWRQELADFISKGGLTRDGSEVYFVQFPFGREDLEFISELVDDGIYFMTLDKQELKVILRTNMN